MTQGKARATTVAEVTVGHRPVVDPCDRIAPYFSSWPYLARVQAMLLIEAVPATTLPLWWGALQVERHYATIDYAIAQNASAVGALAAGVIVAALIGRVDRRLMLIALLGLYAVTLIAIALVPAPLTVAVLWGVAFFAMTGIESMGLAYLGYSRTAQRNNGIYVTVQTLMFGIAPLLAPAAMTAIGTHATLFALAGLLVIAALLTTALPAWLPALPAADPVDDGAPRTISRAWWIGAGCAMTAYAVFAWYTVTFFNFSEQFGSERGVDLGLVGLLLGIAGFIGIPGSLIAAYGDRRWRDTYPVIVGALLFVLSCVLLAHRAGGVAGYAAGLALSSFSWSLMMPYVLSLMARIDPYGRVLAASYTVKGIAGVALAAGNTAAILAFGLPGVAWVCGGCVLLTLATYLVAHRAIRA